MHVLVLHPTEKRKPRHRVRASVRRIASSALVTLRFEVEGAAVVEWSVASEEPQRRNELWKSTCFECFAGQSSSSYGEWNFAPNGDWAAYRFGAYRDRMESAEVLVPAVRRLSTEDLAGFEIDFSLPAEMQTGAVSFSMTAVILEKGDPAPFYWALVHSGAKPDFHLRESFILELEC